MEMEVHECGAEKDDEGGGDSHVRLIDGSVACCLTPSGEPRAWRWSGSGQNELGKLCLLSKATSCESVLCDTASASGGRDGSGAGGTGSARGDDSCGFARGA